jgi:hypothetical protein
MEKDEPEGRKRTAERDSYLYRQLIAHLNGARDWPRLFDLLERRTFLADQAEHFSGFRQSGDDLEEFALPAAIQGGHWNRFLHYATLAVNLRGLAEALAEPEILAALAQEGRLALARGTVAAIADPLRRAQARAVLAESSAAEGAPSLVHEIEADLKAAAQAGQPLVPTLRTIARHLRPEVPVPWQEWLALRELLPQERDAVWRAVAESRLSRGNLAEGLWESLAAIGDPRVLLDFAPVRLGELPIEDAAPVLERLQALFPSEEMRWLATVRWLEKRAERRREDALADWDRAAAGREAPWSAALIDEGRHLFQSLSAQRIEAMAASLTDPEAVAALRVVALEGRPDADLSSAALRAVGLVPPGDARLHWSLRYLKARPPQPEEEVRRQVGAVLAYLSELRFEAPAADLARYLDLAARFLKHEMGRQVENVVWSPATRPDTLRTLAAEVKEQKVLAHLLENAERYAAGVSATEAEGFQLRAELIVRLACRLCLLRGDLVWLERAAERLLPEEEDELRTALARSLAREGSRLADRVCAGIRDRRKSLLAFLSTVPPEARPPGLLSMRSLYAALADVHRIDDELLGLMALLETPHAPRELIQRTIGRMRDRDERIPALLRLARHAIAFETARQPSRPDRTAVIEAVRDLLTVGTDDRLAALTPDIAALGSQAGGARAVAEHQEAARRLLGLETVPWPARLGSFERLLASLPEVFPAPGDSPLRAARRTAEVLAGIARLPAQLEKPSARAEVQGHWPEILPMVIAAADRLPLREVRALDRSLRMGLAAVPVPEPWLELCLLDRDERAQRASRLLAEPNPGLPALRALIYLLAGPAPGKVPEIVQRLPAGADRSSRVLRLIRHGWLPPEIAATLVGTIVEAELVTEARVWLASPADEGWIEDLSRLVSHRAIDPSDPSQGPLLCRLWQEDSARGLPALAFAVLDALRTGGRPHGESALRLWLHTALAPRLGMARAGKLEQVAEGEAALTRALSLAPEPAQPHVRTGAAA